MVDEDYLLVAKVLTDRNKNRLKKERSPKEMETDDLFFWIMSRLEWSIEGCLPAKVSHSVTVDEPFSASSSSVILEHGRMADYISQYVSREEFYSVMQEVVNIFNELGKNEEIGYDFHAVCLIREGRSSLTVNMNTII